MSIYELWNEHGAGVEAYLASYYSLDEANAERITEDALKAIDYSGVEIDTLDGFIGVAMKVARRDRQFHRKMARMERSRKPHNIIPFRQL